MSTDDVVQPLPNPWQLDQSQTSQMATKATGEDGGRRQDSIEVVFQKIDEEICRSETECPGPRLSILQSWIEHLEQEKQEKLSEINESEVLADTRAHLQRRRSSTVSAAGAAGVTDSSISKSEINLILSHERNDTIKVRQVCILIESAIKPPPQPPMARGFQYSELFVVDIDCDQVGNRHGPSKS